jgi:hypothetical protein
MPQSDHWAVPFVVETAIAVNPARVLDVGVGMGQFGLHLRQSLDIARGRLHKPDWTIRVDGIELFEPYRNPIWNHYYDHIEIGDASEVLKRTTAHYDLILMCDVIEHFDKPTADAVLAEARRIAKWTIVTTPTGDYPQGAAHGNAAETHLSAWTPSDFARFGAFTHVIGDTFLALVPGRDNPPRLLKPGDLPMLFHNSAGSWWRCTRWWLPRMVKSRLGLTPS